MSAYNESRRHRLNPDETGPIHRLVSERLHRLVMDHKRPPSRLGKPQEEDTFLYGEAGALFRLLYRMDTNRVGKPEYPELTWGTLEAYLCNNGPYAEAARPLGATCDGCEEDCDMCTRVAMTEEELAETWRLVEGPKPEEAS